MSLAAGIKTNVTGMMLNTGISVLANILLTRYCLAENFGVLNFVTNNLSVLLLVGSFGMEASVGYALVQQKISKAQLAALVFAAIPILLAVVFALLYFLHLSYGFFDAQVLVLFSMLFMAGNMGLAFFAPFYQAEGLYKQTIAIGAVFNGLVCALCLVFLLVDQVHAYLKLFALLYALLYFLYGLRLCLKPFLHLRKNGFQLPSKTQLRPFLHYAASALAANLLFLLAYRIDYWFVEAFCSHTALGNYIQASKLAQLFLLIPTFVATPVFFTADTILNNDPARVLPRITRWVFVLTLSLLVLALLAGSRLFEWIYGPSFSQLFVCLLGLSAGIIALSVNRIISAFWARAGQVRYNIIGNAIALTVIVILDALFIKRYGIVAAAFISSAGYVLFLSFNLYMLKRSYNVRLMPFFIPAPSDMAFLKKHVFNGL